MKNHAKLSDFKKFKTPELGKGKEGGGGIVIIPLYGIPVPLYGIPN